MNLTEKKKLRLLEILKAKAIFATNFSVNLITEEDIIDLLSKDIDFGLIKNKRFRTIKEDCLKEILNCPFILCDNDFLSITIKKLLPVLLNTRYNIELEELNLQYKNGYLTEHEYNEEKELLMYCYYYSSKEGKSILETGHVNTVLNNKIKTK